MKRNVLRLCLCSLCIVLLSGFAAPVRKDRMYYERRGEIVWEVPMNHKMIAFTFDDGPNPKTTNLILDLLKEYDAKATFFVVGKRVDRYPEVVEREVKEGHEVANHTYNHVYFSQNVSSALMEKEIMDAQKQISKITGETSAWLRPPGGYYNDRLIHVAQNHGFKVVLWSWHQDTKDWRKPGVSFIVNKVLKNARNGDIVLMHDHVSNSMQTVEALKIILPELKKQGFQFVTVSDLINEKRKEVLGYPKK
ncbi:polysaccharide deacetylase family protein [Paenibacillus aquistagni]|uniref:polysaccharide deacetylase family protein n=1 Tax=Paenibacillus aquistagni TaxID=1852522 RepID=UPI00145C0464|nr:polysaccharide deacetylase family protein [Paenibacillus aquistagni]NMM50967.1 polysaccharide deacetylase family protein [Paenibacillus aquistagni]